MATVKTEALAFPGVLADGEPAKIVVFGAGVAAVNGEYLFAGRSDINGSPTYTRKNGQWDGKDVTFIIYCSTLTWIPTKGLKKLYQWSIQIQGSTTIFYESNHYPCASLPPSRGWWYSDDGTSLQRPPVLFYDDDKLHDWRMDPTESLSDFKIEIVDKDASTDASGTTVYDVHKVIICRSKYFEALCSPSSSFVERSEATSRVKLPSLAATRFPYLLDYLYKHFSSPHDFSTLVPSSVGDDVATYWLADYSKSLAFVKSSREHRTKRGHLELVHGL
jgi:hypothetical protein